MGAYRERVSRSADYRDRLRGGPPRELAPHGTREARQRHRYHGEPYCAECVASLSRPARALRSALPG